MELRCHRRLGLMGLGLGLGLACVPRAMARPLAPGVTALPNPDRAGLCYLFRNDVLTLTQPCVIGSGTGWMGRYLLLNWSDGVRTTIGLPSPGLPITVDGVAAQSYQRGGVFLQPLLPPFDEGAGLSDRIFCERVIQNNDSICYRILD